ncbi:unnamed protein product [Haemonchus placei]|uniref:Plexin_cytopl domain-containing protein n=1 Tax=Haemonchus placei TaxID=6290 RepID=A0A0N4VZD1_HAEPC|nr:unnamed protein product [Haemonchus placei]
MALAFLGLFHDRRVTCVDGMLLIEVKEKCLDAKYRTVPYSDRPNANDLDLEWRAGINGRIVLQDIDATSRVEPNGWKRLNTLAHYNVPNNAVLMLMARQNSLYNLVSSISTILFFQFFHWFSFLTSFLQYI